MSRVQATLTYIKSNPYDVIAMICGIYSATIVSQGFHNEYPWIFWSAFPVYVISAACATYSNYLRKHWAWVILFGYYFFIDALGVFNNHPNTEMKYNLLWLLGL